MHLTNTLSKARRLCPSNGYSSSQLYTIFKSCHTGSHQKRIWWRMQHRVLITQNLLTWVCRYARLSLGQHSCDGSCIPSSQLPRSEHSAKLRKDRQKLRLFLSKILLQPLPIFLRNSITLACSNLILGQTCNSKILSRDSQILPCANWSINQSIQR